MTPIDPHDPAFAHSGHSGPASRCSPQTGLTIRAEFAKAAMQGLLGNKGIIDTFDGATQVAAFAVEAADALIEALNQPKP